MVTASGGRQSAADAADAVKQQIRGVSFLLVTFCSRRQLLLSTLITPPLTLLARALPCLNP